MLIDVPAWARWLDVKKARDGQSVRYRVLLGGRGGGKSWAVAAKLIERAMRKKTSILCLREYQNSIADSAKQLLEDLITRMGIGPQGSGMFTFGAEEIRCRNGSRFRFKGLHGAEDSIRSLEGVDIAWVEEAASISKRAIEALIPTIRRPQSEIWFTYNPRFPTDPVDMMFRSEAGPPPGTVLVEVGWHDNKWLPAVLKRELDYDRGRDPEKYSHVWGGGYLERSEATVFRNWQPMAFDSPHAAAWLFGADWGFKDPTVLVRCFVGRLIEGPDGRKVPLADPDGRCLFIDHEVYQIGCELDDIPAFFAGTDTRNPPRWGNRWGYAGIPGAATCQIRADTARLDTIIKMLGHGLNIVGAAKGPGSVLDGVEFLRNYDIYVHPRCCHTIQELMLYSFKVDRQTGKVLPDLADKHNHVIDALRYATEGARRNIKTDVRGASAGPRVMANLVGYGFGTRITDPIAHAEALHRSRHGYGSSGMRRIMDW